MKKSVIRLAGLGVAIIGLAGCQTLDAVKNSAGLSVSEPVSRVDLDALSAVVAARSDEEKARDQYRHPAETMEFFGIAPDMTVVEALPGQGWYSRVIIPYVNANGGYGAVNYQAEMFKAILPNASEERLAQFQTFPETFPAIAAEWGATGDVTAWSFGEAPEGYQADAVLFIRALHNLNRSGGAYIDDAIGDAFTALKPGGIVGVVQHRAPETATGAAASGANGYLRQTDVIATFEAAGFVFEEASEINANPADQPGAEDIVWRLPPTLGGGDENKDARIAIGERDRMTLRFRKPE